jgi:hypothetical protein
MPPHDPRGFRPEMSRVICQSPARAFINASSSFILDTLSLVSVLDNDASASVADFTSRTITGRVPSGCVSSNHSQRRWPQDKVAPHWDFRAHYPTQLSPPLPTGPTLYSYKRKRNYALSTAIHFYYGTRPTPALVRTRRLSPGRGQTPHPHVRLLPCLCTLLDHLQPNPMCRI